MPHTEKQRQAALANLKKIKRPGGAANPAWIAAGKRNLDSTRKANSRQFGTANLIPFTSETGKKFRKAQLETEEAEADKMREEGYEIYSPTVVCDRIAVKDGRVFFVDFKKLGQKLRPGQQRIHDLVPEMYQIRYHNAEWSSPVSSDGS